MSNKNADKSIILFDGVCNLCNSSVQFVLKRDSKDRFRFAPLQSETAKNEISSISRNEKLPDSIILIENQAIYTYSTAALRIAKKLSGLWPLLYALIIIPRFVRDPIYKWIAKNRYNWFGRRESCMVPEPKYKQKFLEES